MITLPAKIVTINCNLRENETIQKKYQEGLSFAFNIMCSSLDIVYKRVMVVLYPCFLCGGSVPLHWKLLRTCREPFCFVYMQRKTMTLNREIISRIDPLRLQKTEPHPWKLELMCRPKKNILKYFLSFKMYLICSCTFTFHFDFLYTSFVLFILSLFDMLLLSNLVHTLPQKTSVHRLEIYWPQQIRPLYPIKIQNLSLWVPDVAIQARGLWTKSFPIMDFSIRTKAH